MEEAPARDLRPLCGVCGKRVERLDSWREPLSRDWVYVARCHGSEERFRLREHDIVEANGFRLLAGVAFDDRRLGPPA